MTRLASTANLPLEPFGIAIARRILTQTIPFSAGASQDSLRESAQSLLGNISSLSTGLDLQRSEATRALVAQQLTVADDIADLFPRDAQMQLTADQFRAKADGGAVIQRNVARA